VISPMTLLISMILAILILRVVNTVLPHRLRLVLSLVVIVAFLMMLLSALGLLGPLS
jgi:hypothetical protein